MPAERLSAALARAVMFGVLWLVLAGFKFGDLPAATVAVVAATWASLSLLPPDGARVSALGIARLALRFPWQSVVAGVDVAWRAFSPSPPLRPGFVTVAQRLPAGTARDAFTAYASLMPGTLPVETTPEGLLLVHCLDTRQQAAEQMAAEEALFAAALGRR